MKFIIPILIISFFSIFVLTNIVFAEEVCPTVIGWKIVNNSCISDAGCDYDFSGNTTYYGTKEMCLNALKCPEYYTCPNGKNVSWCGYENGKCLCIISPENQCYNITCTDSDNGKNYYINGCMNNGVCDQCGLRNSDGTLTDKEYCKDEYNCILFEVYCTPSEQYGGYFSEDYKCPYGCKDGACLYETEEKCTNHAQCSQACDDLGINYKWMGSGSTRQTWYGTCPSDVYGCMTGECCLGQCQYKTTGDCTCQRTNSVDIYGSVCPSGTTCGSDCYCHSLKDEYKTVNLGETFSLSLEATDPYQWKLKNYDKNYLEPGLTSVACGVASGQSIATCVYSFPFKAIKTGQTTVEFDKVNKNDDTVSEAKYFHITIIGQAVPVVIAYLNKPFTLKEGGRAEVVDFNNMRIKLNSIQTPIPIAGSGGGGVSPMQTTVSQQVIVANRSYASVEVSMSDYSSAADTGTVLLFYEGETKSVFGANIKLEKIDTVARTAVFLVTLQTSDFKFKLDVSKNFYSRGETAKIKALLSGSYGLSLRNATVEIRLKDPNGNVINLPVEKIGTVASECSLSSTTNTYTCPVLNQYSFYSYYDIPSDAPLGYYSISAKASVENIEKYASSSFTVGEVYSDFVDVKIYPEEMSTEIGEPVEYRVTVTDKHPLMRCPVPVATAVSQATGATISTETETVRCGSVVYNYLISVDGLPYHSVYPNIASVQAGSFKTFELKIFPGAMRTSEGIATAVEKVQISEATEEQRAVGITGKVIAEAKPVQPVELVEAQPVREAVFKFSVKASLREDPSVSDSDTGVLRVRFVQTPEPPPFPEPEKTDIELRKGWNLVSAPGKGSGFTQGTCSAEQKPLAFVYLQEQQRYASFEEALKIMDGEKLLEYISTHSFWIYSYEDCNIGFKVESYSSYSGLPLVQGWNLLGITKDMVGETLSSIKGSCSFVKIYTWDANSQKWLESSESDLIEKIGYGVLVKTSLECKLKENLIQPPPFPTG